jgi:hypothetical protein
MDFPATKGFVSQPSPAKTGIIPWLPVVVFMVTAALIRWHSGASPNYYLLAGSDGPYYPLQVRAMSEHFRLAMPDMPLLFFVAAALARALQFLHVASSDGNVLLAIRCTNSFLPPLAAIPVFLIGREFGGMGPFKNRLITYLVVAYSILNFSPVILFSNGVLQKNAVAVIWIFFFLYYALRVLRYGRQRDEWHGVLLLLLCALTHYGSAALLLLFSGIAALFWLIGHKAYLRLISPRTWVMIPAVILFALGLIAFFDAQRFHRLVSAPLNLFRAPVLLFALRGQPVVLTGYVLVNLLVVNLLALFAAIFLVRSRKQLDFADKSFTWALIVLALILSSPIIGLEYANRLFMMSYVPISIIYLFLFNRLRSGWVKAVPVLLLSLLTIFSIGSGMFDRLPVSITDSAFAEFRQINKSVPFTAQSVIFGRQDLRLLGSWVFRTKQAADYLFQVSDFDKYDGVYIIQQTSGSNLRAARFRQLDIPSGSLPVFTGNYFEVYRIPKGSGWNPGRGLPFWARARGKIVAIRADRGEGGSSAGRAGRIMLSTGEQVDFSKATTIELSGSGAGLAVGMEVEVSGNWEPFSLTVDAADISEVGRVTR